MKFLTLFMLIFTFSSQACIIQFQVTKVTEKEQKKGPLIKTVELMEDHSIDADSILRISYDLNTEPKSDNILIHFKNKTILNLGYDEAIFKNIKQQFAKCKK